MGIFQLIACIGWIENKFQWNFDVDKNNKTWSDWVRRSSEYIVTVWTISPLSFELHMRE